MQSMALRLLGGGMGSCFLGFCFNGRKHLGFFDWEVSFNIVNVGLMTTGVLMVILWMFLGQEDMAVIVPQKCADCCHRCGCCCHPAKSIMVDTSTFHMATSRCQDAVRLHTKVSKTLCTSLFSSFVVFELVAAVLCWMLTPQNDEALLGCCAADAGTVG